MNNGPNLMSLLIIGGVAGVSVFGLYLGYKAIFDQLESDTEMDESEKEKKKDKLLSELLSRLPEKGFDAEKTLSRYKNKLPKSERTKLRGDKYSNSDKKSNSEKKSKSENKESEKRESIKKDSIKKESDKETKKKVGEIEVNVKESKETSDKIVNNNLVIIEQDVPEVMNKKKVLPYNKEVETLLELPDNNGEHAEALMDDETIRTVDKANLKKKKRTKKKRKDKN